MSGVALPTGNRYAVHMTNTTAPAPEVKRTSSILNNIPGEAPEGLRWALREGQGEFDLYLTSEITPYGEWEEWERDDRLVTDDRYTLTEHPQNFSSSYLYKVDGIPAKHLDQGRYDYEVKGEPTVMNVITTVTREAKPEPSHMFRKAETATETRTMITAQASMKGYIRRRRRPYREFEYEHRFRDIADLRETLVVAARTLVARHETRNV